MRRIFLLFSLILILKLYGVTQILQKGYYLINDTTNLYPSIDKILEMKELNRKVVYIDLWGTRCPPCLKEFQYSGKLKERFQNDSVTFLYLCSQYQLERDTINEKLWEERILKNELKGIHILISNECYKNGFWEKFKDKYTEERSYQIPTFLLVDKKGVIRNFDAPRPSNGEFLYEKIQALLNEN
jgi:thiol-disulfide isomerase/thioredoxin